MIDIDKTNYYVKMLMGNLSFKADYKKYASENEISRLLVVEGTTDKAFIQRLIAPEVTCVVANQAFRNNKSFGTKIRDDRINYKSAIVQVVYGLSRIPQLITCPGSEKWNVYGMIDLDFDDGDSIQYTNTRQLFVTDTHDLETLLLSTDGELLNKTRCVISNKDVNKAFYMAYQIGIMRDIIYNAECGISLKPISAGGYSIEYDKFTKESVVNIYDLLNYANDLNSNKLSTAKLKIVIKKIQKDRRFKKNINSDGYWNKQLEEFDISSSKDFWSVVNGHDILSLLKYYNSEIEKAYATSKNALDREFEFDLINNYEYKTFEKTDMYNNMLAETIIQEIQ